MFTLSINEEVLGSGGKTKFEIPILSYQVTLAELIEAKVKARVSSIDEAIEIKSVPSHFMSSFEKRLNKIVLEKKATKQQEVMKALKLDPEKEVYQALDGFQKNAFFVIIDGEQKTELQETLRLSSDSKIQFIKLTPLVGG